MNGTTLNGNGEANATQDKHLITGIAHINILVPEGSLSQAHEFYSNTLGFASSPVPAAQKSVLRWFNIGTSDSSAGQGYQQVHVSCQHPLSEEALKHQRESPRHPCFKVASPEALLALQRRIYEHFARGGEGAPMDADRPGEQNSGSQGVEYPSRFFARDYAGNRLEFSL